MSNRAAELDIEGLWTRCRDLSDIAARNALIEHYSKLVRMVAASLYGKRPDDEIEFDEYYQFGLVGLIQSVDRYRPDKNAAFETFASYRIRGAILNGLEKVTERRDQSAFRARMRKERLASLSDTNNKKQNSSLFEEMVNLTLGLAVGFMLEDTSLIQKDEANYDDRAYQSTELSRLKSLLVDAVDTLSERERLVIQYHYFQQTPFENIADILSVSKGRVSQIHKRALMAIREKLRGPENLDGYF
ncbi:MAG: sigma-70 family RNA polymerase sigma factor [Pseudomonadales bacterium]